MSPAGGRVGYFIYYKGRAAIINLSDILEKTKIRMNIISYNLKFTPDIEKKEVVKEGQSKPLKKLLTSSRVQASKIIM